MLIMGGLIFGIGTVLLLDFFKGPVRHEIDINDTVLLPVIGHIPKISR
jgi:capsular polysaccharide biosynthesis protein